MNTHAHHSVTAETNPNLAFIILAAGKGTRMRSNLPKVLQPLANQPMLQHVLEAASELNPAHTLVVTGHESEQVEAHVQKIMPQAICVNQGKMLGTGHAVKMALPHLKNDFMGTIVVLYGDAPLIQPETLARFLNAHAGKHVSVLTSEVEDPTGFGRIVRDGDGVFLENVEEKDTTPEQKAITEVNTGIFAIDSHVATPLIHALDNNNANGEFYLTDILKIARLQHKHVGTVTGADPMEALGANDRAQLAELEDFFQDTMRQYMMKNGVTLQNPSSIFFSADTLIAPDVTVEPNCYFGPNVVIHSGVRIRANSYLEGCVVGEQADIGPFARLRPGTALAANTKIGNFVEIKKASIGKGSKVNHLSYVGDASVGEGVNVGAGTICANYNSLKKEKNQTVIKDGASIGANTVLVAPTEVGENAFVGASTVVRKQAPAHALVVDAPDQLVKENYTKKDSK